MYKLYERRPRIDIQRNIPSLASRPSPPLIMLIILSHPGPGPWFNWSPHHRIQRCEYQAFEKLPKHGGIILDSYCQSLVNYPVEGGLLSQTCNVISRHYKLLWHWCTWHTAAWVCITKSLQLVLCWRWISISKLQRHFMVQLAHPPGIVGTRFLGNICPSFLEYFFWLL